MATAKIDTNLALNRTTSVAKAAGGTTNTAFTAVSVASPDSLDGNSNDLLATGSIIGYADGGTAFGVATDFKKLDEVSVARGITVDGQHTVLDRFEILFNTSGVKDIHGQYTTAPTGYRQDIEIVDGTGDLSTFEPHEYYYRTASANPIKKSLGERYQK